MRFYYSALLKGALFMDFYEQITQLTDKYKSDYTYISTLADITNLYENEYIDLSTALYLTSSELTKSHLISITYILQELYLQHISFTHINTFMKNIQSYNESQVDVVYWAFKAINSHELRSIYLDQIIPLYGQYTGAKMQAILLMYEFVTANQIKEHDALIMSDPNNNFTGEQINVFSEIHHKLNCKAITYTQAKQLLQHVRQKDGTLMTEILNVVIKLNNELLETPLLRDIFSAPDDEYEISSISDIRIVTQFII